MTIATLTSSKQYVGNGVTTDYAFPNRIFGPTNLVVTLIDPNTGSTYVKIYGIDYAVNNVGANAGSTVSFFVAPTNLWGIDIRSVTDNLQSTDIANQGAFFPELHEDVFDKLTREVQDLLRRAYTYGIHGPDLETVAWPALPIAANRANTYLGFDASGLPVALTNLPTGTLTRSGIGALLYPISQAEQNAGVTVVDSGYVWGNVLRYGIIPNNSTASVVASNSAILQTLLSPLTAGPMGLIFFPNTTGADIYCLSGATQIRDDVTLDLQGATLNFSTSCPALFGFLNFIRDVTVQNGNIDVTYDGTGLTNSGSAFRIGSRSGYPFGAYPAGIFDKTDLADNGLPPQGNWTLRNLRIRSNNPSTNIVSALGGFRNGTVENVLIDGRNVVPFNGYYYEYGFATTNGQPGTQSLWSTSHAVNMTYRNMVIVNMKTGGTSQGFGDNGSYNSTYDGIYVNGADNGFVLGAGESFYYRVWTADPVSPNRQRKLRNIVAMNCAVGASLQGAAVCGPGTLMYPVISALAAPAIYQAQTDFMSYSLDGFAFVNCNVGLIVSGERVDVKNGAITGNGAVSSGGLIISAETPRWSIENVDVTDCGGNSVRMGISPGNIWATPRLSFGKIRNSKFIGSTGIALNLTQTQAVLIEGNQIGRNTLYDVAAETTQTVGVNLSASCYGVRCSNNFTSTSGGNAAYASINAATDSGNIIESERNLQTVAGSGHFITDFQSTSAVTVTNGSTISIEGLKVARVTNAGVITGSILQAGYASGHEVTLINEGANTITFAAAGTSRVADGVSDVIVALSAAKFVWNSGASLWYRVK